MAKKTAAFERPTVEQVKAFMIEKMGDWPEEFAQFYAEKFWNSYEKSGWRLSAGRGGLMKSWTAAFSSNWKHLEYESDRKKLQAMQARENARKARLIHRESLLPATASEIGTDLVDGLMKDYLAHPTQVVASRLAGCYDWIKANLRVKLSKEQTEIVIGIAANDKEKAKATVVQWVFEMMAGKGQTFKQLVEHV